MDMGLDDGMILEGIVTTVGAGGEVRISPMGPMVDAEMERLVLRPYQTSSTFANLKRSGAGVFHVTDDVMLLAQAAVGAVDAAVERATCVDGFVLADCCRFYEFEVRRLDDSAERTTIEAAVVRSGRKRDFFGFNRGKHAVVEAAILATRTAFLPAEEILGEFERLAVWVDKTGGARERAAFAFLNDCVRSEIGRAAVAAGVKL
jgi:hypothetical protein